MHDAEQPTPTSTPGTIEVAMGGVELLPSVQPLWESLFDHQLAGGAAGLPVRPRDESWPLRLARYERLFERQPAFVLVANQGNQAVGYALAYADDPIEEAGDGPVVTIESLVVTPELRGQGLGGWLLEEAEAEAIEQWGAEVCALEVMTGNESADGFFARAGFVERGETWLRPAAGDPASAGAAGAADAADAADAAAEQNIDDDRLGDLLEAESELFAIGLEEGPDETWLTSVVLVGCQPEPELAADGAALEAALAPFAAAGASSALVALDRSNDPGWGEELARLGFKKVLRLLTRSIVVEQA